jgi:hypothetical protein
MDGARGAFLPIAIGFRGISRRSQSWLQGHAARKSVKEPAKELGESLASGRGDLSGMLNDEHPARNGFGEG